MSDDHLDDLIARYLDGMASPAECDELGDILASDGQAAQRFATAAWQHSCLIDQFYHVDEVQTSKSAPQRMHPSNRRSAAPHRSRRYWRNVSVLVAALLLIGILVVVPWTPRSVSVPRDLIGTVVVPPNSVDSALVSKVYRDGGYLPLTDGMNILADDRIESEKTGFRLIYAGEQTEVTVEPGTVLVFGLIGRNKSVTIDHGRLTATVAKQPHGSTMCYRTAYAEATVIGTRLDLSVADEKLRLSVDEGAVHLKSTRTGKGMVVAAGSAATVSSSGLLTESTRHKTDQVVWDTTSSGGTTLTSIDMEWFPQHVTTVPPHARLRRTSATSETYGWVTVQDQDQDWRASSGLVLTIRGLGDGRVWNCEIYDGSPQERFIQPFVDTVAGWREIYLPFNDFTRRLDVATGTHEVPRLEKMNGFGLITTQGNAQLDVARVVATSR